MQAHLIAPPELIPLVAARLVLKPPSSNFCLHPLKAQLPPIKPDDLILLIQSPLAEQLAQLQQQSPYVIDLTLIPSPLAPSHGFITLASGSKDSLTVACELINCLAPIENGWLHIGDLGACCFLQQLWHALITPQGTPPFLNWATTTEQLNTAQAIKPSDLIAQLATFMAQQQLQTQALASLARHYLATHPEKMQFMPHHPQSSALFNLIPSEQSSNDAPIVQLAKLLAKF
ncbi:hypothetical protein NT239_02170 [Chitinibacter sp. SCUT-21]|uniref:hypothetical protein n=1 Tax=Chitinibacter sp. SCUT-21 TaxID=2970891 RepID=UPI0035A6179A